MRLIGIATVVGILCSLAQPTLGDDAGTPKDDDPRTRAEALVKPLLEKKQSVGVVDGVIDSGKTRVFGFGHEASGGDKTPDGKRAQA